MTARTSAGGVRPFKAYGHLGALQKPRISRSTAVAAGGVRPLWTHRGTAKTTRCAQYGGGGGQDPTLNQLWAARGAAKTTRSVQHGGGSRRGPTLMDTPRDCKTLTFRAARRWQRAGSDSDGHPWEPRPADALGMRPPRVAASLHLEQSRRLKNPRKKISAKNPRTKFA